MQQTLKEKGSGEEEHGTMGAPGLVWGGSGRASWRKGALRTGWE